MTTLLKGAALAGLGLVAALASARASTTGTGEHATARDAMSVAANRSTGGYAVHGFAANRSTGGYAIHGFAANRSTGGYAVHGFAANRSTGGYAIHGFA